MNMYDIVNVKNRNLAIKCTAFVFQMKKWLFNEKKRLFDEKKDPLLRFLLFFTRQFSD